MADVKRTRSRRERLTVKPQVEEVEVEELEEEDEEEVVVEKPARRTKRSRAVVEPEPEDEDPDEEEEDEEPEPVVVEKPARRERRRGAREVVKAVDDVDEELEEMENEFVPPQLAAETTLGEFMETLPAGVVFQISKVKGNLYTIAKMEETQLTLTVVTKKASAGMRGKAYWDTVLTDEYQQFKEEWTALTEAERVKRMKKDKIAWDEHDAPNINNMRMSLAYQSHHNIEKFKPEYASRAARDALK